MTPEELAVALDLVALEADSLAITALDAGNNDDGESAARDADVLRRWANWKRSPEPPDDTGIPPVSS